MNRRNLAKALRRLAAAFFNGGSVCISAGICLALEDDGHEQAYSEMARLMRELGEVGYFGPTDGARGYTGWEPRAWMCLFLAEYLEGTL